MADVRWDTYPLVAHHETARTWLQIQAHLQLAPKTIDAYGRCLNDYLTFCAARDIAPERATREHVAAYVNDLATRPNPRGAAILTFTSGVGLSNATMQQRLTVARLFHDYLIEAQLRPDNPVGRGHYVPGKGFGGARERGLVRRHEKLPWIPSDDEWRAVLQSLRAEPLRNRLMVLLAYDGALRREELVGVEIADVDVAYRQVRIRAERAKNGAERVVGYGTATSQLLARYLERRRALSVARGPLFLSESRRNPAQPLSAVMWAKIVGRIAARCALPRLTTHTLRHLRLTHLARARLDLHQIATYAGHRSLQTTMLYVHLGDAELTEAVARGVAGLDRWMAAVLEGVEQ
jgi:integrase/recombinase XerD